MYGVGKEEKVNARVAWTLGVGVSLSQV